MKDNSNESLTSPDRSKIGIWYGIWLLFEKKVTML